MAVTITHTTPADGTFSATGAAAWDANHAVSGLGTMAEQNANNVNITGGSITGVTGVITTLTANATPTSGFSAGQFLTSDGTKLQATSLGTIATQNANSVAITGGNIDGTAIGGTTQSSAKFTTLNASSTVTLGNYTGYVYANGAGAITAATTIPNSGLANSSVTINGTSVSLGGSATISASTTGTLTLGTGLSGTSFNGSTNVTAAIADTTVTANSYGSSSAVATFTVNAQGQLTAAANSTISIAASQINTTIPISGGGTGQTTASAAFNALSPITSVGDLIIGNGTNSATRLAIGTNGYVLTSNGTTASWAAIPAGVSSLSFGTTGLTPNTATTGAITVAGTLVAANGGTGQSSYAVGDLLYASDTTTLSKLADVATGSLLASGGVGVAPAWSASPTLTTSLTTPLLIGGTTASSSLTLQSTSGVGTTDSIAFKVGNNGATTAMTINTSGQVGIGTASPTVLLDIYNASSTNVTISGDAGVQNVIHRASTDASAGNVTLRKSRGTIASPTAVASSDQIGSIFFSAYGGTNSRNLAIIRGSVETYTSDTDISSFLTFFTSPTGSTTPTERMRIRSDGNIGIGGVGNATSSILVSKAITGGTSASGINIGGVVQPTVTSGANYFLTSATTASNGGTPYTVANLVHYGAAQPTGVFNADSTVTNQFGFWTQTNLIGATNNYSFYAANTAAVTTGKTHTAFYSNVNTATGGGTTYGFYAAGTATNYFNGNVGIGTSSPASQLTVNGAGQTTSAFNTTTSLGGSLMLADSGASAGNGGALVFSAGGTTWRFAAIKGFVLDGSNNSAGDITFSTRFATTNATLTEAMRITYAGNVGIGTSSPGEQLSVAGAAAVYASVTSTGGIKSAIGSVDAAGSAFTGTVSNHPFTLTTNNTERMRIDSSGNVGIGSTGSADNRLRVSYSNTSTNDPFTLGNNSTFALQNTSNTAGNSTNIANYDSGGRLNSYIRFLNVDQNYASAIAFGTCTSGATNYSERMRIDSSGNVGVGTSSPGAKLDVAGSIFSSAGVGFYKTSANITVNNGLVLGTVSKSVAPSGGQGSIQVFSDDAANRLEGTVELITSATASERRLRINVVEQGVAFRNVTLAESGGNVGIGTSSPQTILTLNAVSATTALSGYASSTFIYGLGRIGNGIAYDSYDYHAFYTNSTTGPRTGSERMRIDSSGNVGIGTASPASFGRFVSKQSADTSIASLGVVAQASSTDTFIAIGYHSTSDTNRVYSSYATTGAYKPISFWTNDLERMRIDSSGNVGIGVTPTGEKLNVAGTIRATGNTSPSSGVGVELIYNSPTSTSFVVSYDRSAAAYKNLSIEALNILFSAGSSERMRLDASGNLGIGVTPAGTGALEIKAGTTTVAPLEFNSGTNLTTPVAGAVEYDGTVMTATSNTNFKRGTIPLTNYASGTGTTLTTNGEATLQNLLPAANDTITLSSGTYFVDTSFIITRGASTTSATARLNILGSGGAAGNFSGASLSAPTAGGTTGAFSFDAVNINVSNVLTAASTTSGGVYTITLRGILKITTGGTIVPQYNLSANINGAGTVAKVLYFRLQQLDSQNAAAFGPAGTGWG